MKRREMQPIIDEAVSTALVEKEVPVDPEHTYRLCRTYMRLAARAAIASGVYPQVLFDDFILALQAEAREAHVMDAGTDKPVLVLKTVGQA